MVHVLPEEQERRTTYGTRASNRTTGALETRTSFGSFGDVLVDLGKQLRVDILIYFQAKKAHFSF